MNQLLGAGIVLLVFGAGIAAFFGVMWKRLETAAGSGARLKSTEGTLRKVEIVERFRPVSQILSLLASKPIPSTAYDIDCNYDFAVDGRPFSGNRFNLNAGGYTRRSTAEGAIYGLRVGQKVPVWYDPASPAVSVLRNAPPDDLRVMKYGTYLAAAAAVAGLILVAVSL